MWLPASLEDHVEHAVGGNGPGRIIWRGDYRPAVLPDIETARETNRQNSTAIRGTGTQGTDAITDSQYDRRARKCETFLGLKRESGFAPSGDRRAAVVRRAGVACQASVEYFVG